MVAHEGKIKLCVVCGPTAVGKTGFGIALAESFNGQIIGADSMQVYRHMDIGTAKPTAAEQGRVRHHLIDVVDPDEAFNAEKYAAAAFRVISKLDHHGILPIVVGGTGLYIKALIHGLFPIQPTDEKIRTRLKQEAEQLGIQNLWERLQRCDPETAGRVHKNDSHRILRALEVYEATGMPISRCHQTHQFAESRFNTLKIGLTMEREELYARIDRRVDAMIQAGFLDEVRSLLDMGYTPEMKSMQSIGYRHLIDFVEGRTNWVDSIRLLKRDTRRYAKRQMTWFRSDPHLLWLSPSQKAEAVRMLDDFLRA